MYPGSSTAVARKDLSGLLESFDLEMDRRGFIGNRVLPIFNTPSNAGRFPKMKAEELLRSGMDLTRNPMSGYARDTTKFEDESYTTKEWGVEHPIDDKLSNLYGSYFDMESLALKKCVDVVLREQETRVADMIFNTTTWTGATLYLDVSTAWTSTSAVPITDVNTAKRNIRANFGRWPNTMIFNYNNLLYMREISQVQDRISSSGAGQSIKPNEITAAQLANVFDINNVLIPGATYNSANEGQAAAFGELWSNSYCWIGYVATTNDITEPCVGRTMHWGGDGSTPLGTVETYREETNRSDIVRVRHEVQEKLLFSAAGFLLKID